MTSIVILDRTVAPHMQLNRDVPPCKNIRWKNKPYECVQLVDNFTICVLTKSHSIQPSSLTYENIKYILKKIFF